MTVFTGIIVFLMIYWTVLFCVLPWGNAKSDKPLEGNATSAPDNPRIGKKFLITGIVSVIIWVIIYILIDIQFIDFHEIARVMQMEEGS